jgi:hypothetical protein
LFSVKRPAYVLEPVALLLTSEAVYSLTDEEFKMRQAEPDRIEYCLLSGEVLNSFPFPCGHEISYGHCLSLAQQCLSTYWRDEGGTLRPTTKIKPLPQLVRVVGDNGEEICRWSVDDLN